MTNDLKNPRTDVASTAVAVESGRLRGAADPNIPAITVFKGIPYAAPPIGHLRWKPPSAPLTWNDIRDCKEFGPGCPQPKNLLGFDPKPQDEDCLTLNIWTPGADPSKPLPVMVWIHGGGHTTGAGSQQFYNGANLARHGVVVVTINYRLGPFGYFSHPSLSQESPHQSSGNYGLLDQIAALKWVRRNISAFGGEPANLTVFGESAGAVSIAVLLTSPLAAGLFDRAILQSGSASGPIRELRTRVHEIEAAEAVGARIAKQLGCEGTGDVLQSLRDKSVEEILVGTNPSQGLFGRGEKFGPIVDGWVVPEQPWKVWEAGRQHNIPILLGTNADEGTIFVRQLQTKTIAEYEQGIRSKYGARTQEVLQMFPASSDEDVRGTLNRLITAASFLTPARAHARWMSKRNDGVFLYHFARRPNVAVGPLSSLGAYHGLEIGYVFGNLTPRLASNPIDRTLSESMSRYWVNFARTGNPNSEGLPVWPNFAADEQRYLEFGEAIHTGEKLFTTECDLLDAIHQSQR